MKLIKRTNEEIDRDNREFIRENTANEPESPQDPEQEAKTTPSKSPNSSRRGKRRNVWAETEEHVTGKYDSHYNVITGRIAYALKHPENHKPNSYADVDDRFIATIRRDLARQSDFLSVGSEIVQAVLLSNAPSFNPIASFFEKLPKWDGHDYIAETAAMVQTIPEHQQLWQLYFLRWQIATVACGLHNIANHGILTLMGEQGVGKTKFLLKLFPKDLRAYCSATETISDSNKDSRIMIAEKFIAILDELDSSTRADVSFLKTIVSAPSISVRRPYATYAETLKRICSFCASVNTDDFLRDATGNRRFWVVQTTSITDKEVNTLGLYAQALHLYNQGAKYWFDGAELKTIADTNQQFESTSLEENVLLQWFEPIAPAEAGTKDFYMTSEISALLESKTGKSLNIRNLGQALRKLGFTRAKKRLGKKMVYMYAAQQLANIAKHE